MLNTDSIKMSKGKIKLSKDAATKELIELTMDELALVSGGGTDTGWSVCINLPFISVCGPVTYDEPAKKIKKVMK
ncbi:hypothetical protein [Acinetobacter shaoyimingii]|uniref:Uncharacterized protein n=1 Tax=Acinetobacter shaoyimingii TaxID=2715164 RepID=A0A6G8RUF0_9GAMM|nr:hypothetical protein [Acinetobacter shaoyimingii]NHB58227.1 hypothetical protein [Acinetobacter shaoyimingii]QIO05544.1 hypothetical protein G8E00_06050 [Acinetobacter shaoyimingii]